MSEDGKDRFELGGWWLGQEPDSPNWYRYRYDTVQRSVHRRSLRTADFEAAKLKLAEWITANSKPINQQPDAVYLATVLESYFVGVTDKRRDPKRARTAGRIVLEFFGAPSKVSDLTSTRQKDFMRDCAEKGHSVGYISRNMGVLAAAIGHAELALSPRIIASEATIADHLEVAMPAPREWIPTIAEVAAMLDAIPQTGKAEALFRFFMLELMTAARPEAVVELGPAQISGRIVDLNPPGRKQNKKYRPTIIACACLFDWLQVWDAQSDRYVYSYRKEGEGQPIKSMKKQIKRLGALVGVEKMHRYALRHFVPTELRRRGVGQDEVAIFLGHKKPEYRTTDRYTKFDPAYLANAVRALDGLIHDIDALTTRSLFPPENKVVALKSLSNGKNRG